MPRSGWADPAGRRVERRRGPYPLMTVTDDQLEVGVGPWQGTHRTTRVSTRSCWRRGPAQCRRSLPLLAARGDRRRPGPAPARLPRRDRELAARLQHRHGGPKRQRVQRRRGAHRRTATLEPARRDGDRSLPARAAPRDDRGVRRLGGRAAAAGVRHRQPPRFASAGDRSPPRHCVLLFGQEGPGLSAPARAACDQLYSIAQYGSTRSINAGVASGIAMHAWIRAHAGVPPD